MDAEFKPCMVCTESLGVDGDIYMTQCSHLAHEFCFDEIVEKQYPCPACDHQSPLPLVLVSDDNPVCLK